MRLFAPFLFGAFLVGSALADKGAVVHRTVIGVVTRFEPGRSISIANDQSDRGTFQIELTDALDEDQVGIRPGALVLLRYRRALSDRARVVEEIRVLPRHP